MISASAATSCSNLPGSVWTPRRSSTSASAGRDSRKLNTIRGPCPGGSRRLPAMTMRGSGFIDELLFHRPDPTPQLGQQVLDDLIDVVCNQRWRTMSPAIDDPALGDEPALSGNEGAEHHLHHARYLEPADAVGCEVVEA